MNDLQGMTVLRAITSRTYARVPIYPLQRESGSGYAPLAGNDPTPVSFHVGQVMQRVCNRFDITMGQLTGSDRSRKFSRPRQVAYWLVYKLAPVSYPKIGASFGRHHTTIMYGARNVDDLIAKNDPWGKVAMDLLDTLTRAA